MARARRKAPAQARARKAPATEAISVWPRPQKVSTPGRESAELARNPAAPLFVHASGCCAELLGEAFSRYADRIFWADASSVPPLPHVLARAPGTRDDGTPPELSRCGSAPPRARFGSLEVAVASGSPTELQLGVDESYELELHADGGWLRAQTEWGALRGLETFAQLTQWDGGLYLLCGLPLTLADAPAHAWRGLLLDTARHYLPLRSALLPMLDAMEALKLNTLHWHLTDAHSFPLAAGHASSRLARAGAYDATLTYSAAEISEIVAVASARGIRVVPELDMPAHAASWGAAASDLVISCPKRVAADEEGVEHGVNKARASERERGAPRSPR